MHVFRIIAYAKGHASFRSLYTTGYPMDSDRLAVGPNNSIQRTQTRYAGPRR
jgi:hypothetical protein